MLKKKAGKKLYKKAPVKFLIDRAKSLKKLAFFSFVLSLFFIFLSNPFSAYEQLKNLPNRVEEAKKIIASVPEFIKVFPSEAEKSSFAFFDWSKTQLNSSWPIFAKETVTADKEAGQSAVKEAESSNAHYASLPFFIEIPKLHIYEKVYANVNPNSVKEYEVALKDGVAHALGSSFPDQKKMVYIFGHSTNGAWNVEAYNAVFYQIKDLQVDDQIILHLGDQKYIYKVSAQDIVKSDAADFVNNLKDQNILLLQTCWPPGTSWQRLFVTASPTAS